MSGGDGAVAVRATAEGLVFQIKVLPRSSKNALAGPHDGALKVKLTAPPVSGAANRMCVAFLARQLGMPKSSVEILSGLTGRNKEIRVRWPQESPTVEDRRRLAGAVRALWEAAGE